MSANFQSYEDAASYMAAHDRSVLRLSGLNVPALHAAVSSAREAKRVVMVEEGTLSKDELVAEILALRYPLITEARQMVAEVKARRMAEEPHGAQS